MSCFIHWQAGPLPLVTPEKPKDQPGGSFKVQIPSVDSHFQRSLLNMSSMGLGLHLFV